MKATSEWTADKTTSELLAMWGQIVQRTFIWHPAIGSTSIVRSGPRPTVEEAETVVREQALEWGYKPPRWWQWWRWGEDPLPRGRGQTEA